MAHEPLLVELVALAEVLGLGGGVRVQLGHARDDDKGPAVRDVLERRDVEDVDDLKVPAELAERVAVLPPDHAHHDLPQDLQVHQAPAHWRPPKRAIHPVPSYVRVSTAFMVFAASTASGDPRRTVLLLVGGDDDAEGGVDLVGRDDAEDVEEEADGVDGHGECVQLGEQVDDPLAHARRLLRRQRRQVVAHRRHGRLR